MGSTVLNASATAATGGQLNSAARVFAHCGNAPSPHTQKVTMALLLLLVLLLLLLMAVLLLVLLTLTLSLSEARAWPGYD